MYKRLVSILAPAVFVGVVASGSVSYAADKYCATKITEMCGTRTVTKCFVYSSSWQSIDSKCLDEVERLIGLEAKKKQ